MEEDTPRQVDGRPHWQGKPVYGYDSPIVQQGYVAREAARVADFFIPYLQPGNTLLDCGCGPGTITLGLAEHVAPGQVAAIDLEPTMIERAISIARERHAENVRFQVADICSLPFPDNSFDAVFSSAVLEHLADPVQALQEIFRVLKPQGLAGVASTDWVEPLISPADDAVGEFFALIERGFNHNGGSLNRGRHLRIMLGQAGFRVTDFSAAYSNSSTPEAVQNTVEGYVHWIESWPLFDQAVDLGWVDRVKLEGIADRLREWSRHPDAFLATTRCLAVGQKN